jgi:hypothetical protein
MATAEAQARWRERKRQRDQGKTEVRGIYLRPDLHKQLRAIAAQMEDDDGSRGNGKSPASD